MQILEIFKSCLKESDKFDNEFNEIKKNQDDASKEFKQSQSDIEKEIQKGKNLIKNKWQ